MATHHDEQAEARSGPVSGKLRGGKADESLYDPAGAVPAGLP